MDPPEFRTHDLRDALGPFGAGIRRDDQIDIQKGGPIATAFGYQRPYLRKGEDYPQALTRNLKQPRPRAKREPPPGRAARAGDVPNSKRMRSVFPSEPPGAELWRRAPRRDLQQRTKSELRPGPRRNTVALV